MEEWRDIIDYEGLYQVSNLGRVRSLDRYTNYKTVGFALRKGQILKPYDIGGGYLSVRLCYNGVEKNCKVHRLVAEAFLPNPDNLPCVNHKDENPKNNCVNNLEWCTVAYNNNYGNKNKSVLQYTTDGTFVKEWKSIKEAAEALGVGHSNISCCCHNRRNFNTAYGYIWKFKKAG